MDSIYAELTVVWLVATTIGVVLGTYVAARTLCEGVKNLVDGRRSRGADRGASDSVSTNRIPACVERID